MNIVDIMNKSIDEFRRTGDGKIIQGASHTCRVLNHKNRNKIIIKAVCDLRKIENTFDSIACCGVSGLMVVPQIAELLNKNIIIVRKPDEKRYSEFWIEGVSPFRYVVVDDLICSGDTFKWIRQAIYEDNPKAICTGLYCYIPEECAYTEETAKIFNQRYKAPLLNPNPSRT
jgi:adenine/guanine phosphoribosyltransferase-like PRPP-binding protein